jgi:GT2 family glycosyltransferase
MISIIIPTLGNFDVNNLKHQIVDNSENIKFEIIFCIPKKNFSKLTKLLKYKNIRIVRSKNYNQVRQRLEAVKYARYNFILQLDDDIILRKFFLTKIYKSSKNLGNKFCLSPIFRDVVTKKIIYKKHSFLSKLFYKIFFQIDIDKNYGKLTSFGLAVDFSPNSKNIDSVDWLPGGCMLTKKTYYKNINGNIFQNHEKSYYEDVYFSILSSYKKYLDYRISAYLYNTKIKENFYVNLKYLNYINRISNNKSSFKFIIYLIYKCLIKIF